MDPVFCLKRSHSLGLSLCIFCQERKTPTDDVREAGEQGLNTAQDATRSRKKLNDVKNREIVDLLENVLCRKDVHLIWHRNCYSQYTDKGKIQRLQLAS
ncbi:hypothetical protein Hamer_G003110 [Homarus americanus]|uniref:Uncharacterized protein n=1 Tax=Homarus americanus TaxID=6706 RepID=A0A8J5N6G1_HOMAM|nr:hypothetical protein Hamer_G003110 [Homarus americanus]